jgi:hypothetical protein
LDGDASSALTAGEAGKAMPAECVAPGLRGAAAITELPLLSGSWPAICRTTPLAPAIDPNAMKARASPSL